MHPHTLTHTHTHTHTVTHISKQSIACSCHSTVVMASQTHLLKEIHKLSHRQTPIYSTTEF
jgi:hypothetical protein